MSRGAQLRVSTTRTIPKPNPYIESMYGEFSSVCFDEEKAPTFKGQWRGSAFQKHFDLPLDLEIGTGNGGHFARYAQQNPERLLIGIELKYKPLIQSIRRSQRAGCHNARMARYNAVLIHEIFADEELNNVFIHFPDPWSKSRQQKHRLIQDQFLDRLWRTQKPRSFVEFKTDNRNYFDWTLEKFSKSRYTLESQTFDLHNSIWATQNYMTQFESIFVREGVKINYAKFIR